MKLPKLDQQAADRIAAAQAYPAGTWIEITDHRRAALIGKTGRVASITEHGLLVVDVGGYGDRELLSPEHVRVRAGDPPARERIPLADTLPPAPVRPEPGLSDEEWNAVLTDQQQRLHGDVVASMRSALERGGATPVVISAGDETPEDQPAAPPEVIQLREARVGRDGVEALPEEPALLEPNPDQDRGRRAPMSDETKQKIRDGHARRRAEQVGQRPEVNPVVRTAARSELIEQRAYEAALTGPLNDVVAMMRDVIAHGASQGLRPAQLRLLVDTLDELEAGSA